MLLTNVTYLNKCQRVSRGNILITDGVIKIIEDSDFSMKDYNVSEIIDCKKYIIIPVLINGHYHNGSLLAKGLSKEIAINEWEGKSLQGTLQSTLFQYLDEDLTEEEYLTVCIKGYIDLIKNGVTFVSDSCSADRSPDYLVKAMKLLGISGVIDVEEGVGTIEEGYCADLVFLDKTDSRLFPLINNNEFSNVVHNLIIECREDMIKHVIAKGKWVMRERKIVQVDECRILKNYEKIVKNIYEKYILEM